MKLVIFDSGIGGFSILRELQNCHSPMIYLADQAGFPYGDKSDEWLKNRLTKISRLISQFSPSLVVMGCNTATVAGIGDLRQTFSCPVVGVEPVVKPAAKYAKSLIIGTKSTINSGRIKTLLAEHGGQITAYSPEGLAMAIENNNLEQVKNIILDIKKIVDRENIQAIGLSCTHYPLVKALFEELIPSVTILDPSPAVANRVRDLLPKTRSREQFSLNFITTGDVLRFKYQIRDYLGLTVEPTKLVYDNI